MIWTQGAAEDLEAIAQYIAQDSAHYAALFAIDVLDATERLAAFPLSGRVVPEVGEATVRELLFGSYRIVYQVQADVVSILTVFHGARLLDTTRLRSAGR